MSPRAQNILSLAALAVSLVIASLPAKSQSTMTINRASGEFEVKIAPAAEEKADGASLGRMTLEKQFKGPLQGTSKGEMLTAMTSTKGSAGYVAMERFSGTLAGRSGGFVLQHSGTMNRGDPQLVVTVVPDSATGDLAGLVGRMAIRIAEGRHFYDFDYELK